MCSSDLNQAIFVEGLARATPLNGAVLGTLTPVYTTALSVLLGREQASRRQWAGLAVAMSGALFLVGAEHFDLGHERLVGNLLVMCSSLAYSLYLVLARPLFARYGALPVTAWAFLLAMPTILPWSWPALQSVAWSVLPGTIWLALAWIVATASLAAYALNAYALRHVPASTVAAFVYLQPLITGVTQGRVLGARPGWQVLVAAGVIFVGVALVTWRPNPPASSDAA